MGWKEQRQSDRTEKIIYTSVYMEKNALKKNALNQDTSGKISCLNWKSIFYLKSLGKEVLTECSIHTPLKNCYKLNM